MPDRPQRAPAYAGLCLVAALFTPSWGACGSRVNVAFEPSSVVPVFDAAVSSDAGISPVPRECGDKRSMAPCGAVERVDCDQAGQQLVTRIEPLDCDIARGFTGAPEELALDCQDAFDGQSGDGCSAERTCVRRTLVGCCLELAACHGEEEPLLLRSRACAQNCPQLSPTADRSELFEDCGALLAARERLGDPYRVLGAPCRGDFACSEGLGQVLGRELPFMSELQVLFCVGQQIQILDALPWFSVPQPGADAGTEASDDSGVFDPGGGLDAGKSDAGSPEAGVADAALNEAGAVDAAMVDAGRVDAGIVGP